MAILPTADVDSTLSASMSEIVACVRPTFFANNVCE